MQVCNGSSRQLFGYTADLFLKLIDSEQSPGAPDGMCLVAGNPAATPHANGQVLTFQACPVSSNKTAYPGSPLFQWSLDGSSHFEATTNSQGVDSSFCVNMTANTVGSQVVLGSCSSNSSTNIWRSSPGVGAGMAGDNTNQLVNYAQFSRCLDVTGQSLTATYMIAWFCKRPRTRSSTGTSNGSTPRPSRPGRPTARTRRCAATRRRSAPRAT